MMHHQKLTDIGPTNYTPIALVKLDPAGFQVRADSPWKSVKDVIDAVKASPGKYKASGTGQGGIWHLAIAGLLKDQGIDPAALPWVPSNGAAPGIQDMVAGGVDVVPCSIPEARAMIDAGKVRPLAIMDADDQAGARHRLGHRRLARDRRAQGSAGRRAEDAGRGAEESLRL